jgi:hypothetical protein
VHADVSVRGSPRLAQCDAGEGARSCADDLFWEADGPWTGLVIDFDPEIPGA